MDVKILSALIAQGKTIREIASELGCSYTNTRYWLRKSGLSTARGLGGKNLKLPSRKCGICGETDPCRFYGHKRRICGSCHNKDCLRRGREARAYVINLLGGCCFACGYDKYSSALDCHHKNPKKKDPSFNSFRGWSKARIKVEMEKCVLLCKNCHAAVHVGELSLGIA